MKMGRNIKFVSYIVQWKNAARKIWVVFYAHFVFDPMKQIKWLLILSKIAGVLCKKKFFIFEKEEEKFSKQ